MAHDRDEICSYIRQLLESLYSGLFTLSTPLIKPNFMFLRHWPDVPKFGAVF